MIGQISHQNNAARWSLYWLALCLLTLCLLVLVLGSGVYTTVKDASRTTTYAFSSPRARTEWNHSLQKGDRANMVRMQRRGEVIAVSGAKPVWFWYQPHAVALTPVRIVQGPHIGRRYWIEGEHLGW